MIKAIVFDFAGVIADGPIKKWLRENFPPKDPRQTRFLEMAKIWDVGKINEDKFYKIISDLTGIGETLIWDKICRKSECRKEITELIIKLKKNYKIILFSNNFSPFLKRLLKKYEIINLFDKIIISSDYKMVKPDTKFYKLMLKETKLQSNEVIFIDDNQTNIDAASILGINSLLFTSGVKLKEDFINLGVLE